MISGDVNPFTMPIVTGKKHRYIEISAFGSRPVRLKWPRMTITIGAIASTGTVCEAKNKAAFDFLTKFQLTTDQQNEIAAMIDSDGQTPDAAAKTWVDANPDIVNAWLG